MINDHLSASDKARNLLKSVERLHLTPYDDQTGTPIDEWCKGATIGYGYLIKRNEWDQYKAGISKELADKLFDTRVAEFENAVRNAIIVTISQQQFDALVIFAYNIGSAGLRASSTVRLINDPRAVTPYPTLEKAWKAWNKSQGVENKGLNSRRACEWDIYSRGVYRVW